MSRHHKKCSSNGGTNAEYNISYVPLTDHRAWHGFAKNLLPPQLCDLINQKYLDAEWMFICVRRDKMENGKTVISMKCPACGETSTLRWDEASKAYYCPLCGAKLIPMHGRR